MGTNGNTVKRAVVLLLAVVRALLHGTFNAFVCLKLVIHIDGLLKFAYAGIKGNASKRLLLSIPALLYSAHWHHTLCIYREKAEKSKVLRLQEFEQLQQDDIRIHTGDLAGQRLVDVLVSDLMETAA